MPSRIELANAIRALSMDAVQKAKSGHPGAPMGMADIAEVLWNDFLSHNPKNPNWPNRDRFVLSNGHGSMLIYSLLHLSGYDLSIEDLKQFRQMDSRTPGHPEYGYAPGVETTTGPLGQGITNGVGMALAEKVLAAQFNKDDFSIVDHYTYVFLGDGCLMEGISHEACSLAGTHKLGKLIAFYDDNNISIDGEIDGWFTDDTPKRFESYGWQVIPAVDGHDPEQIKAAVEKAQAETGKPTLICCKTIIGKGSPNKAGSHDCHGAPLGDDEIAATRKELGWEHAPFVIPQEIKDAWDGTVEGVELEESWNKMFAEYKAAYPELAQEFERRIAGDLPADFTAKAEEFVAATQEKGESLASRASSQKAIEFAGPLLPELLGGSADLSPSNNTEWSGTVDITPENAAGNYMRYGVREFAMSAIMNGMVLHGGFIPYAGTFLVFSDYARNALRMSALMKLRCIYVYTHDSIGLGEDGPTHQPVEHVNSLRLMPNMNLWRPCDAVESAAAWKSAIEKADGPSSLIFTRQKIPHQQRTGEQLANIEKGAYVLREAKGGNPDAIIMASGSEVGLAMDAADKLEGEGKNVRVVSMPSMDVFDKQDKAYQESVLPANVTARVSVEAGTTACWGKYLGLQGKAVGMDCFGESAPADELFKHFGFTVENVVDSVKEVLG